MKRKILLSGLISGFMLFSSLIQAAPELLTAPADAKVYFIQPVNGVEVPETFKVVFGLSKMGVAPAGTMKKNTGHHHLLIDMEALPDMSQPLGKSEQIRHFGGGQTEAMITLPKGQHTLQLVLGNFAHTPHSKPVVSEKITIYVK